MELSAVIFFLVVLGFSDVQAGPRGRSLAKRVTVMEEEMKSWKIATLQAKTRTRTLARRMRLVSAATDSLKLSLQNTKTQLKEITQELGYVRRERDTYSESLRKLRDEMTRDVHAFQQRLNLTNEDLFATKQQITGITEELMTLKTSCCGMRKDAKETDVNKNRPAPSSLAQMAFTTPTTMYPGTTAVSTYPSLNNTVAPAPVTTQDLQASTTDVSEDLTPGKTVPPTPVTTQNTDPHATPSPADRDLYFSSREGNLERVKRILAAGHVNINTRKSRWTSVLVAAWKGHWDVVEFLVGRGADVSLADGTGNTVLHYACRRGHLKTVKLILSLNVVDINCRGEFGNTPVMEAAGYGHNDVVEFLVGRGADVSLVSMYGNNILHYACQRGHLETVNLILSLNKVDINSRGYSSETPVMAAARNRHRDVVEFLVGRGADVSLVNRYGDNVLHVACFGGDLETVKLILSLNVLDINARNNSGRTATDYARNWGHKQVVDLLVSSGRR